MKGNFKKYFNLFLYLSFGFVAYSLYKRDYLAIPDYINYTYLIWSLLALFAGFVFNAVQWVPLLKNLSMPITYIDSIRTFGMAIFGKYIPGKIWVHLGKSAQLGDQYGYSVVKLSEASLFSQVLTLWVGVLYGMLYFAYLNDFSQYFLVLLALWVFMTLFCTTKGIQRMAKWLIFKVLKKEYTFVSLDWKAFLRIVPMYFLSISFYSIGFYFLVKTLGTEDVAWQVMFVFPVAMSMGVLAFIMPGGIGVREGIIIFLLGQNLISSELATSSSVMSRIWFLLGEAFIFLLAFILKRMYPSTPKHHDQKDNV